MDWDELVRIVIDLRRLGINGPSERRLGRGGCVLMLCGCGRSLFEWVSTSQTQKIRIRRRRLAEIKIDRRAPVEAAAVINTFRNLDRVR